MAGAINAVMLAGQTAHLPMLLLGLGSGQNLELHVQGSSYRITVGGEQWLSSGHRDPNRQSEEGDPAHTQVSPSSPAASFFWSLTRHSPHVAHANLPYTWQFAYIYMTICLHIHYGPFCVCVCRSAHDPMYPPRPLSTEAASVGVSMWCGCHHGGQLPLSAGTAPPIGAAGEGAAMRRAGDGARVTVSVSNRSRLVTMPSALRGGSCRRRVSCGASVSSG